MQICSFGEVRVFGRIRYSYDQKLYILKCRFDFLVSNSSRETCQFSLTRWSLSVWTVVLCIGSNLGLKFGRERPIRVLLPHLAEPKIYK